MIHVLLTSSEEYRKITFQVCLAIVTIFSVYHAQDNEDDRFKRDFSAPTLEDQFDKSILPKVMQV